MKCTNCGADFASDQLRCPYCGTVNEHALKLAKELQSYDAAYEKKRDELLESGTNQVLRHLTFGLGIVFLVIAIVSLGFVAFYQYRFSGKSSYEVSGSRLARNKEMIANYLDEGQYIRAYLLASTTDPTGEHFQNYPEHAEELYDIYNYSIILVGVLQSMESMDEGDNYAALQDTDVISFQIFYSSKGNSTVKEELTREVDGFLRDYYRLTEEEIETLKTLESGKQFTLEGSADIESVTKRRMEAFFEK